MRLRLRKPAVQASSAGGGWPRGGLPKGGRHAISERQAYRKNSDVPMHGTNMNATRPVGLTLGWLDPEDDGGGYRIFGEHAIDSVQCARFHAT